MDDTLIIAHVKYILLHSIIDITMRIEKLLSAIDEANLDAYIVSHEPNILYYTNSISGGKLIITPDSAPLLITSDLNLKIAQDEVEDCDVESCTKKEVSARILKQLKGIKPKRIGFDSLSLSQHRELVEGFGDVELVEAPDLVWQMRKVKDHREQDLMRRAGVISDIGMEAIKEFLEEGVREYEVAAEAAYAMRREGAGDISFPFIVASGLRSTYPHAGVSERKIRRGDFVTVDMGAAFKHYKSDNTRTFIIGSPTKKQRDVFETVLDANEAALPEIRKGAKGVEVDKVARDIIEKAGYGEAFIHGLGHGVGLEVHEPPSLSKTSEDILEEGNIVSNEPGIYLKDFGIRIEDTVLVTHSSPEKLTRFDKDLDAMRI